MVDLIARSPVARLLPVSALGAALNEVTPAYLTLVQPYAGQMANLEKAMKAAHGLDLPSPGNTTTEDALRLVWFARQQYLLVGDRPADVALAKHAALIDQSDAWVTLHLTGDDAAAVLARHCPLDLRKGRFAPGQTARAPVAHLPSVVTRLSDGFEIMLMQSLATSGVHHLADTIRSVAGQKRLR